MTKEQEQACIENIQSYLDRIGWDEVSKACTLCDVFGKRGVFVTREICAACPLGPRHFGCMISGSGYMITFKHKTSEQLKTRMRWLLKKYKAAGLDIEITEVE